MALPFCLFFLCVLASPLPAQERSSSDGTADPNADYSGELPRIPPRSPAGSLAAFRTLPGFRVELVASEPQVEDPIAISFDARGRMYVVCMRGYSEQPDELLGQIRLLEDANRDGRYETSSVFVDGLSWPTGVICWGGGVFVAVAPDILFFRDTDGDGRADVRETVLAGFGRSNVQGLLNSLSWGLDNRIHGATSSSGGTITSAGRPSAPAEVRGRDFAFDPRTRDFETTSGGAQHGLSFDDWGRRFVCSNSSHIQMVLFEDRYLRRNPYLAAPGARRMIASDGGQAEVYRLSPVEPWRIVRTRLRVAGVVPGPVEGGGRAAGYFTGSTGVTIYRGDLWPAEYRGQAFIGDVGSNIVHRKRLTPESIGFRADRVDEEKEFLASTENWIRPVQFANAPDGALYVIDMYREVIEHPASLPPVIKKHLDLTSGRDRGRIYRIVPEGARPRAGVALDAVSTRSLVELLEHRNGWHRDAAARLLYERQDRTAVPPLEAMARAGNVPEGRLHALYALDGLAALTPDTILAALGDPHPRVREHAVRLAERVAGESAQVRAALYEKTGDEDLRVRYQLAFTLGEIPGERSSDALARILARDASDEWVRLAAMSSLSEGAEDVFEALCRDESFRRAPAAREVLPRLAEQLGRQSRQDAVAAVLRTLEKISSEEPTKDSALARLIVRELAGGLEKSGSPLRRALDPATAGEGHARGAAARVFGDLLSRARKAAADETLEPEARAEAIRTLGLSSFERERGQLAACLDHRQPREVQLASLAALSRFDDPRVVADILAGWTSFSPGVRARAAEALFARPERVLPVLDAIELGTLRPTDLEPSRIKLLRAHADSRIRERALEVLADVKLMRREEIVAAYRSALTVKGDPARGREAFKTACAPCHRLEGVGEEIGPNLAAMRNRGAEAILLNVLDPNREVNPEFLSYVVVTNDGRSMTGMIASETATSVTLRRREGESVTVLRVDIARLESTGLSLMPEDLEKTIDVATMADLISYLMSVE